jgi:hypothetical protein
VSPLRSGGFTSARARSLSLPEELAFELGGTALLVVEPVPLFGRAVSAALDTCGAS